jgi:hypothetical protein
MTDISGQRLNEIMILKKGGMHATRCFPFGIFYEIAIAQERIFVRNSYPSPCAVSSHASLIKGKLQSVD